MKEKLLQYIEEHKDELFTTLLEMIGIDTQNDGKSGSETPLAQYMQRRYEALGVPAEVYSPDDVPGILQHPDYLAGRNLQGRCNVSATLHGSAPLSPRMPASGRRTSLQALPAANPSGLATSTGCPFTFTTQPPPFTSATSPSRKFTSPMKSATNSLCGL